MRPRELLSIGVNAIAQRDLPGASTPCKRMRSPRISIVAVNHDRAFGDRIGRKRGMRDN
jgi:hypothetical protein